MNAADDGALRRVNPLGPAAETHALRQAMARLRASALASVFGLTAGTGLFIATAWLVLKGGAVVGPHLGLLGQYLPGYRVTWGGAVLGFAEAGMIGGAVGYAIAILYNRLADLRRR